MPGCPRKPLPWPVLADLDKTWGCCFPLDGLAPALGLGSKSGSPLSVALLWMAADLLAELFR